jgi:hypothetical protein
LPILIEVVIHDEARDKRRMGDMASDERERISSRGG